MNLRELPKLHQQICTGRYCAAEVVACAQVAIEAHLFIGENPACIVDMLAIDAGLITSSELYPSFGTIPTRTLTSTKSTGCILMGAVVPMCCMLRLSHPKENRKRRWMNGYLESIRTLCRNGSNETMPKFARDQRWLGDRKKSGGGSTIL
jgi:hypothetical protein